MVNSRQALGPNRVLVTLFAAAISATTMITSTAIGVPGVITDVLGLQHADIGATVVNNGVTYDIVRSMAVVVDVPSLPAGLTFPGPAVACSLADGAATAGITLAPVQPSAAEFAALCSGTITAYTGAAAAVIGVTADGILGNLALGLGGQTGAHLLASNVASTVVIAKGDTALEKLAYVVGLAVRLIAIVWLAYLLATWLWARRPAVMRSRPRAIGWSRA